MNIQTGEVRDVAALTEQEKRSGNWIPLRGKMKRKYAQKQPVTDEDRHRIIAAEAKRLRKKAHRLEASAQ